MKIYYQNEPKFNFDNSGNNLPKAMKDADYVGNRDVCKFIVTQWIAF